MVTRHGHRGLCMYKHFCNYKPTNEGSITRDKKFVTEECFPKTSSMTIIRSTICYSVDSVVFPINRFLNLSGTHRVSCVKIGVTIRRKDTVSTNLKYCNTVSFRLRSSKR